jgi:hypothetical protein
VVIEMAHYRLILEPAGWPVTLGRCPPGLFIKPQLVIPGGEPPAIGVKSEYHDAEGYTQAYVAASGEWWSGGAADRDERERQIVQPLVAEWEEVDE